MSDILLRVQGTQLVRGSGAPVVLRGLGLGGWMNMENFITGYPASESQQRAALRKALGDEGYRRFFDRFLAALAQPRDDPARVLVGPRLVVGVVQHPGDAPRLDIVAGLAIARRGRAHHQLDRAGVAAQRVAPGPVA